VRLVVKKKKKKCNFWRVMGKRIWGYDERSVREMRLELFSWWNLNLRGSFGISLNLCKTLIQVSPSMGLKLET
jgi:hypothetical protein